MPKSVLFVDDDPAIRETVEVVLKRAGYEVTIVPNAEEGLAILRDGFTGLLLLDVMMPEMDGWGMIDTMRAEGLTGGVAICMLTGMLKPGLALDDLKDLVQDYILKPFTAGELIEAVERNISWIDS